MVDAPVHAAFFVAEAQAVWSPIIFIIVCSVYVWASLLHVDQHCLIERFRDMLPSRDAMFVLLICGMYIVFSAAIINFNKYLMKAECFPYPVALSMCQMACSSVISGGLYRAIPSLFQSLKSDGEPGGKRLINWRFVATALMPIGAFFALQILLANAVYQYLSIAFIQMMKMSNVGFVYMLSVMIGLDRWATDRVGILILIVFATSLTVEGEAHFSLRGFLLQGISQLLGCVSLVLQGTVLTKGSGKKLDVLSYNLLISPITLGMLCVLATASYANMTSLLVLPAIANIISWWPLLLSNAVITYGLNIGITMLVKYTSPVGLCLAGLLKDAAVVVTGVALHGESISSVQTAGFLAQMGLIYMYADIRRTEGSPGKSGVSDIEKEAIAKFSTKCSQSGFAVAHHNARK